MIRSRNNVCPDTSFIPPCCRLLQHGSKCRFPPDNQIRIGGNYSFCIRMITVYDFHFFYFFRIHFFHPFPCCAAGIYRSADDRISLSEAYQCLECIQLMRNNAPRFFRKYLFCRISRRIRIPYRYRIVRAGCTALLHVIQGISHLYMVVISAKKQQKDGTSNQ